MQHADAAHHMDRAAHFDLAFAGHRKLLPRSSIGRTGHHRPAFGHVRRGIRARRRTNLERIAGRRRAVERHNSLLIPALNHIAHRQPLVDGPLATHKLGTGATAQVDIGKAAVERPCELRFQLIERSRAQRLTGFDGIERLAVAAHHVEHVVGVLHPPFDFEGGDPGSHELGDMPDGAVIARAEQPVPTRGVRPARKHATRTVDQSMRDSTGLRAVPPICRPPSVFTSALSRPSRLPQKRSDAY